MNTPNPVIKAQINIQRLLKVKIKQRSGDKPHDVILKYARNQDRRFNRLRKSTQSYLEATCTLTSVKYYSGWDGLKAMY